jgi:hypothetical protein
MLELVASLTQGARSSPWWKQHRVYQRTFGSKRLHHPGAGDLAVDFESLTLRGDPGQTLFVYTAEEGTTSRQALDLLAKTVAPARTLDRGVLP